jgi:hypothetical protein
MGVVLGRSGGPPRSTGNLGCAGVVLDGDADRSCSAMDMVERRRTRQRHDSGELQGKQRGF